MYLCLLYHVYEINISICIKLRIQDASFIFRTVELVSHWVKVPAPHVATVTDFSQN